MSRFANLHHFLTFTRQDRQAYTKLSPSLSRSSVEVDSPGSQDGFLEKLSPAPSRRSFLRRWSSLIISHIVTAILYGALLYYVVTNERKHALNGPGIVFTPAREAVHYQEHRYVQGDRIQEHSIYSGPPSDELDLAWHNLLNDENIRLSDEVMRHYGREDIGVAIPEGGGFIGTLNVYHELHCIKRIHQYMYESHYFPAITPRQREMNRLHNEHCLDFLRQASMCHGDVGLITYEWSPHSRIPVANATTHECVDWTRLTKWTAENTVDMMKPGWLVHPTMGPAYPDGQGDTIGAAETDKTPGLGAGGHDHGAHGH
ncbi:hypothetical protein MMC30_009034 [Trapelia coarctata]|nr:hypothetical protein [Trapelia coarctata]